MGKRNRILAVLTVAVWLTVIAMFFVYGSRADAHVQVYPHSHPHVHSAYVVDLLLTILWIVGGSAVVAGICYLARRIDGRSK